MLFELTGTPEQHRLNATPTHSLASLAGSRVRASWVGLDPGTYELTVHTRGFGQELVRVPGIRVTDGPVDDPRLTQIDLRETVKSFVLRVAGADGRPIRRGRVRTFLPVPRVPGQNASIGGTIDDGQVVLESPGPLDVLVLVDGYQVFLLEGLFEDRNVVLRPSVEIGLELLPWPSLPPGVIATLETRATDLDREKLREYAGIQVERGEVGAAGRGHLVTRDATRTGATLVLRRDQIHTRLIELGPLDLTSAQPGERFILQVPPDALARALQELGRTP
jgi:hypothetical protein